MPQDRKEQLLRELDRLIDTLAKDRPYKTWHVLAIRTLERVEEWIQEAKG